MHEKGIAHRDLKLPNILLMKGNLTKTVTKVADFGLSRACYRTGIGYEKSTAYCG